MTRMTPAQYDHLCNLVRPFLTKRSLRKPISVNERVAVTLLFLAHGDSARSKAWAFRIGKSTIYKILYETCDAIWQVLHAQYLPKPSQETWEKVIYEFWKKWNFPNCIGALDGKHITIQAPPNSNSLNYNYKGFFSFILMAISDANYKFIWIDVGDYGSNSDGGVWGNSNLGQSLKSGTGDIPPPKLLPGTTTLLPCTLVGDEAFPLKSYVMRPYPRKSLISDSHRIFNYRLSRARRIIENAFGILVSRWRILNENNGIVIPGQWRNEELGSHITRIGQVGSNRAAYTASAQRDTLREYFMTNIGAVDWQFDHALRGYNINIPS
ncbi:nuclease harbi1-like protein [Lasius niger]|uniref:Nuclease harbi1-like protein n=1 Tax=Lasius niger TaxID=67767 RepID=A0A0J7K9P3_LASNI|nr:nuclease harbi1-like protein [Lasius niger]